MYLCRVLHECFLWVTFSVSIICVNIRVDMNLTYMFVLVLKASMLHMQISVLPTGIAFLQMERDVNRERGKAIMPSYFAGSKRCLSTTRLIHLVSLWTCMYALLIDSLANVYFCLGWFTNRKTGNKVDSAWLTRLHRDSSPPRINYACSGEVKGMLSNATNFSSSLISSWRIQKNPEACIKTSPCGGFFLSSRGDFSEKSIIRAFWLNNAGLRIRFLTVD